MQLRRDLPAGLVVFLIALPMCLGIALASDAPLVSGLIAGVVGGLIVAPLSGTHLTIAGPAAGLTVLVAVGIQTLGSFETVLVAVMLAGLFQIGLGLLRMGSLATIFPHSVIKGMLAGIGLTLILRQLPLALGRRPPADQDATVFARYDEPGLFADIGDALTSWTPSALGIFLLSLAVLWAWDSPPVRRARWSALLPGPLVVVAIGVVMHNVLGAVAPALALQADAGHLVQIPVFHGLDDLVGGLPRPDLSRWRDPEVLRLAVTLAVIASVEGLLTVEAIDKLDPLKRRSRVNKELLAQGVGNLSSGALGGLPLTAVIVRSSTNVYAGAATRAAAMIQGGLLGAMVLAVPGLLNQIPLASLAAILTLIGYRLTRVQLFRDSFRAGLDQFAPFLVTLALTVLEDLLIGVAAGFVVSAGMVLLTNHHSSITVRREGDTFWIRLVKDTSFLNKPRLRTLLDEVPDGATVHLDGQGAMFIDHDIQELLEDFLASAERRAITVHATGLHSRPFPFGGGLLGGDPSRHEDTSP